MAAAPPSAHDTRSRPSGILFAILLLLIGLAALLLVRRPSKDLPPAAATGTEPPRHDNAAPPAGRSIMPAAPHAATSAKSAAPLKPPRPPAAGNATPAAAPAVEREDRARVDAAGFRNDVPPGGALITGGWRGPDGRRVLVLAVPQVIDGDQVQVAAEIISAPESALTDPGWAKMLAQADGKLRLDGGVFDAEGLQAFRSQLAGDSAYNRRPRPVLHMRYDLPATLTIGDNSGQFIMSLLAARRDDGFTVGLAVSAAEIHQPAPAATPEKP